MTKLLLALFLLAGGGTVTTIKKCPQIVSSPSPRLTVKPKAKPVLVVTPAVIVRRMHAYCASLGYTFASTDEGEIGLDDTDFACEDAAGVWYWFRWGSVK